MGRNFSDIGFEDFRRMAVDPTLTPNERIGFPDSYRDGYESAIAQDIVAKLPVLLKKRKTILDIGPGCAGLPRWLIGMCADHEHSLLLVDSQEMLDQLPDEPFVTKLPGFFPECRESLDAWKGRCDAILTYSVLHYVFVEANLWRFLDYAIELLADGGALLIGDIPNVSKRKRFFSSRNGVEFHQRFMQTTDVPEVRFDVVENDRIDDSVILGMVMRARAQGCDAYWLPQPESLPMANRREDVLICKP